MKEVRNCVICRFGKFTTKITSRRKTCSTACSKIYTLKTRKEYNHKYKSMPKHKAKEKEKYDKIKDTAEFKAKTKAANIKQYARIKNTVDYKTKIKARYDKIKDTPKFKIKRHERYLKSKMEKLNNERG